MAARFGGGRELKKLETHLWDGETVDTVCIGMYGKGNGLLALTNRRLMFLFEGIMQSSTEDFPLDKISSVQWNQNMAMGTLTIYASGNKAEVTRVVNKDGKAIADRIRAVISGQTATASPAPAPPPPPPPSGPPAGWYANPENPQQTRWWDGTAWTEHIQTTTS